MQNGLATHDDPYKEVKASENLNSVFPSGSQWPANHKPLPATGQTEESRLLLQIAPPLLNIHTSTLYMSRDCLPLMLKNEIQKKFTLRVKKHFNSVQVKHFCQRSVSVFSNSPSGSLLHFLRNCIFIQIKWDTWHERSFIWSIFIDYPTHGMTEREVSENFCGFDLYCFSAALQQCYHVRLLRPRCSSVTRCRERTLNVTVQTNALCNGV